PYRGRPRPDREARGRDRRDRAATGPGRTRPGGGAHARPRRRPPGSAFARWRTAGAPCAQPGARPGRRPVRIPTPWRPEADGRPMNRITRLLPLVAVAVGGVVALKALA